MARALRRLPLSAGGLPSIAFSRAAVAVPSRARDYSRVPGCARPVIAAALIRRVDPSRPAAWASSRKAVPNRRHHRRDILARMMRMCFAGPAPKKKKQARDAGSQITQRQRRALAPSMENDRSKIKRTRLIDTKDWKWLLWESGIAHENIHAKLGAGWTAVLKEACCVRNDVDVDKVNRLREDGDRGPLRLWPRTKDRNGIVTTIPFKGMVPTVSLLEWCVRRKYKPNVRTFTATARGGDMEAVRWLREHKCPWDGERFHLYFPSNACIAAAEGGHLDVLRYLRESGCPCETLEGYACAAAAGGGHLDVIEYLRESGCKWNEKTCSDAARGGHLNVLKYAHENGCPWGKWTCWKAAEGGHLDVLKYARENGCPWNETTCGAAAAGGHLDVLKYALENACPMNMYACSAAAREGHLDVLQYLHKNGCPWDKETCWIAAKGGHLDVLKYAHENGCPWTETTCWRAAQGGHLAVLKFAHENGCPWDKKTWEFAARYGHLHVLKYAHENGCRWGQGVCTAAAHAGHLDVLKYARENKCPWNRKVCQANAEKHGHDDIVEWIDSCRTRKRG